MDYQRTVGYCPGLAAKIDELVAEKFGYEFFDDPISDARFEQQLMFDRRIYREELLRAIGGVARPVGMQPAVETICEFISDETLQALLMMYKPFVIRVSDDDFYVADYLEVNNTGNSVFFKLGTFAHEARFRNNRRDVKL